MCQRELRNEDGVLNHTHSVTKTELKDGQCHVSLFLN